MQSIKVKALVYVVLVHAGLAFAVTDLVASGAARPGIMAGVALMYSAFLFSALSIWLPLRPWLKRYHFVRNWQHWVLNELPTILALIPVVLGALKILKSAWGEIKTYEEKGELNVKNLAHVAGKFAEQAEGLSKEPGVERVKKRIRAAT
jgi:hypothetical protein